MPEELILKQYDSEVKAVEGERAFDITITTNTVDRSGDIVEPKGARLTNFKKNPVVLMAHNYTGLPIAKAKNLVRSDTGITARVIFPNEGIYPLADTIYRLYKDNFMKAWSIGFIPIKSEDIVDDEKDKDKSKESYGRRGRRFKIWELLEFSGCAVPNNPDTLNNMISKGIDVKPLEEAGFIEIEDGLIPLPEGEVIIPAKPLTEDDVDAEKEVLRVTRILQEEKLLEKKLITKPEETDDLIRIPAKGEEGKHKGHKIRWITVSAKEGIRGIYCIDCKKIISFVFDKKKGWTMEKAKKWMAEHGKTFEDIDFSIINDIDKWLEFEFGNKKMSASEFEEKEEKLKDIIKDGLKDVEPEEIDPNKLKASLEKDEKEKIEEIKLGTFDISKEIFSIVKENEELKEKIKELELKAGAVLNAKNKKDLKTAQTLIQSVLDSATTGEEEDSLEITDEKEKDDKGDNIAIDLKTDTADDPPIDKGKDEDKIEVDEKVIAETIEKHMNYLVGKIDKSNT